MRKRLIAVSALLFAGACAGPGRAEQTRRISPVEAHERVEKGRALFVCAYEQKHCPGTHLAGGITLEELELRLRTLPSDHEIILFCG